MARKKGSPKTGGREPGSVNRITGNLREKINSILSDNIDRVQDDLDSLVPKERLAIIEKLLSYAVPKLTASSIDVDLNTLSDEQLNQIINSININENE